MGANRDAQSDADGRFRLGPLLPGHYDIHAQRRGFPDLRLEEVRAGASDVEVWLLPGIDVSGRVLDATGKSVGGALIILERRADDDGMRSATTGVSQPGLEERSRSDGQRGGSHCSAARKAGRRAFTREPSGAVQALSRQEVQGGVARNCLWSTRSSTFSTTELILPEGDGTHALNDLLCSSRIDEALPLRALDSNRGEEECFLPLTLSAFSISRRRSSS